MHKQNITQRIFDAAGGSLTVVGGAMLMGIPRPDLQAGGASIALCGLIITDFSFKGQLGINWLTQKCGISAGTALGSLGVATCVALGGGEMLDVLQRGEALNPYEPGYLKILANAVPFAAGSALNFPAIRRWLEDPENDKIVTRANNQAKAQLEEKTGKPLNEITTQDIEQEIERNRKWLKKFRGSTIDASKLGLFALGNAMISGYGALAGNSAQEIGAILFSGSVASIIALANRPGKHVAGLRGMATALEVKAYDKNTPIEQTISYEYFERVSELGAAIAKNMHIDAEQYGRLLMSRMEKQQENSGVKLRT